MLMVKNLPITYLANFKMEKIIMKKLVLLLVLSVVAGNAFGMQNESDPCGSIKALSYPLFGTITVWLVGHYGSGMWANYLALRKPSDRTSDKAHGSNLAPYAKIAVGIGLTGLTAYLGATQTHVPQSLVSHGNSCPSSIMISFASAYTLAPMVPAYFLLKSGCEDLNAERDLALKI